MKRVAQPTPLTVRQRLAQAGVLVTAPWSFEAYADWYAAREVWKGAPVPADASVVAWLQQQHPGKLRSWMPSACWVRGRLRTQQALEELTVLDCEWTRAEGLVQDPRARSLGRAVTWAGTSAFWTTPAAPPLRAGRQRVQWYRTQFATGQLRPSGVHAFVLRTLDPGEHAQGSLYLHDGLGRALGWLSLVREGCVPWQPIEVFAAVRMDLP